MSANTQGASQGTDEQSNRSQQEEWADVTDPNQRRKIQNKLAQRRFRDKVKEQKDEAERSQENQRQAGSAYVSPEPELLDSNQNLSGLPWGGISMKHIVEKGKTKEQISRRSSRENSVQEGASQAGGSGRLGLRLTDQFARGVPAWKKFGYGYFPYPDYRRRN